eukprot:gnl/MRDRNA2_/MRDRNA2_60882_c0_seq1.p1 gnl/MRDRNA2_/MRDRNA2_60882_c0~~gnl/MRDRNA2_/MRDRNA2_60882_c0_seq1.p1  ORF type:complete len:814 (-),score=151.46 gnl/MRDRNA2_/MRDRNA2_60882_c0_seq1:303-2744(-)
MRKGYQGGHQKHNWSSPSGFISSKARHTFSHFNPESLSQLRAPIPHRKQSEVNNRALPEIDSPGISTPAEASIDASSPGPSTPGSCSVSDHGNEGNDVASVSDSVTGVSGGVTAADLKHHLEAVHWKNHNHHSTASSTSVCREQSEGPRSGSDGPSSNSEDQFRNGKGNQKWYGQGDGGGYIPSNSSGAADDSSCTSDSLANSPQSSMRWNQQKKFVKRSAVPWVRGPGSNSYLQTSKSGNSRGGPCRAGVGHGQHHNNGGPYRSLKSGSGSSSSAYGRGHAEAQNFRGHAEAQRYGTGSGWEEVEEKAREIASQMVEVRMDDAVCAIQKIPDRVEALVQQAMSNLMKDVQENVEIACSVVREDLEGSGHTAQEAIENLEVIPEMVKKTFDNRKHEITQTVNQKINNVINDIERNRTPANQAKKSESDRESDSLQVLVKLQRLPEEVKGKVLTKIQDAAEGARSAALTQLDYAVMHQLSVRQQYDLRQEMLQTIPEEWPQTIACAEAIAGQHVEQAMAQIMDAKQNIPNQAVADAILAAKMKSPQLQDQSRSLVSDSRQTAGPSTWNGMSDPGDCHSESNQSSKVAKEAIVQPLEEVIPLVCSPCIRKAFSDSELIPPLMCSPGSHGHPELCAKPCLHYWKGECFNGAACKFCHRPHPKRQPRFDKRRRDELKRLTVAELKELVLPILHKKARYLGLETEVSDALNSLRNFPSDSHQEVRRADKYFYIQQNRIRGILEAMTLSTILKMVQNLLMDSTSACSHEYFSQAGQAVGREFNKLLGLIEQLRGIAPTTNQGAATYRRRDPCGIFLHMP